jgi:hypothetical protein
VANTSGRRLLAQFGRTVPRGRCDQRVDPRRAVWNGHPYLAAGEITTSAINDWLLALPADDVLPVSPDRLLPIGVAPVWDYEDDRLDFRKPRTVGETALNPAFTSLPSSCDGRARVRLAERNRQGLKSPGTRVAAGFRSTRPTPVAPKSIATDLLSNR